MEQVEVSFHPDTYELFFEPLKAEHPQLMDVLVDDFARYQQSQRDDLPDYFGFDSEFGSPPEIAGCLEHIHLCIPPRKFPRRVKQPYRKCKKGDPENDVALVYVRGLFDLHKFCILGLLMPDAHKLSNDRKLMLYLGRLGRAFKYDN